MDRRTRWIAGGLVAWTVFVWSNRLRNLADDTDASDAERLLSGTLSVILLVLAVAGAVVLVRSWRSGWTADGVTRWTLRPLAAATVAVWAVRGVDIVLSGWDPGFVIVHLVLAAVSIALAVGTWRGAAAEHRTAPARSKVTHP